VGGGEVDRMGVEGRAGGFVEGFRTLIRVQGGWGDGGVRLASSLLT